MLYSFFGNSSRIIATVLIIVALVILIWFVPPVLTVLMRDWSELLLAVVAVTVMGLIGRSLTFGRGLLAGASQYDKLLVWSALGLSIVSAITTARGLQELLLQNESEAPLVASGLALLLALSIQAYMLNNALRIGEGMQKFTKKQAIRDEDDLHEEFAADVARSSAASHTQWRILAAIVILLAGIAIAMNASLVDFFRMASRAVVSVENVTGLNPIGFLVVLVALFMLQKFGFLSALGAATALVTSLVIYLAMLLFSSGFGYMFYFTSVQTETVQATDRNAFIRINAPALVKRIIEQTEADLDEASVRTREGDAFQDFSARMNQLAEEFRDANAGIQLAQERWEQRRLEREQRQIDASARLTEARNEVTRAEGALRAAERSQERQLLIINASINRLTPELEDTIRLRDAELTGLETEGASGVRGPGPEYDRRDDEAKRIQREIDTLTAQVAELAADVVDAQAVVSQAQAELQRVQAISGPSAEEEPLRPSIADAQSFIEPLTEYRTEPSLSKLQRVIQACSDGAQILINAKVPSQRIPNCDAAAVEADFFAWKRSSDALKELVSSDGTDELGACERSSDELEADRLGRRNVGEARLEVIPDFLQARIDWVVRCMDAANTGTEGMQDIVNEVKRLESEYLTPNYDPRRILSAPFEGNRFAFFSLILAVVVDTAILFAGIGANAQRGRELSENHKKIAGFRQADRVRGQLALIDPDEPGRVAVQLMDMAMPETHTPGHESPFSNYISVSGVGSREANQIKRVMTAAGTEFARNREVDGQQRWYLHANLIALLTEIAGSTRAEALNNDLTASAPISEQEARGSAFIHMTGRIGSKQGRRRPITTLPDFARRAGGGSARDSTPPNTQPNQADDPFNE